MKKKISNILRINLRGFTNRNYHTSVKYFQEETHIPFKRIDYTTNIVLIPNQGGTLLDISKGDIWFNQHEPDLMSEIIANDLSQVMYPIQIRIGQKDMSWKGLSNYNQIQERWKKWGESLRSKYETPYAQSFYDKFSHTIKHKNRMEKSLQYDWFQNLFFHPKHMDYGNENSVKTHLFLSVIPYQFPLMFRGTQTLNNEITSYHSIEIHFQSDEMEAHSYFIPKSTDSRQKKSKEYKMRLNVFYDLDAYHLFPMHIRAYFEVYSKDSSGEEVPLKRIEYTQYQQNTEQNKKIHSDSITTYEVESQTSENAYRTHKGKTYTYQEWEQFKAEEYKRYQKRKKN